ncbi:hypothetical protein Aperf_G00000103314 [Anoplocephala perfoliata]
MNNLTPKRKFSNGPHLSELAKKNVQPQGQCPTGVFLGGACNPTTWRKDVAIPFLEKNQIPYYNPQVDEWRPELIAKEADAKKQASCLLFVFQPHLTRGLSALVELAFLAACVSCQTTPSRVQRVTRSHSHRPRFLIVVRPSPRSASAHFDKKSDTMTEAASIEAAYEWLEGLQLPNVHFFELLENALQYIKNFYSSQSPTKSPKHSNWRKARKMLKSSVESGFNYDSLSVSQERLLAAYQFSTASRDIPADLHFDLYFGGAPPKKIQTTDVFSDCPNWVVSREGVKRNFALSMAVQSHCPRLYFHISRTGLWIVEQMEAAFAIGSGKEVFLCVEYLNDEETGRRGERSENSSGYSSLATTPDEIFQPPKAPTAPSSASASSMPSRSTSSSEYEESSVITIIEEEPKVEAAPVIIPKHDTVVEALSNYHDIGKHKDLFLPTPDVFGLSAAAVRDHNRSRSYLKSLLKETSEDCGKGYLLDRPVVSISDLVDLL